MTMSLYHIYICGDGCISSRNIIHSYNLYLTQVEIETYSPTQQIGQLFGAFVVSITYFIDQEKLRLYNYSQRE